MNYWYYKYNSEPTTWEHIVIALLIIAGIGLLSYIANKLIDKFC